MHRSVTRASAYAVAAALISAFGVAGVSAAGASTQQMRPDRVPSLAESHHAAVSGARLWLKRYNGPGNGDDKAPDVAVSPDGSRVYVTGTSRGAGTGLDYATAAYNAATGARLWVARYNGPVNRDDSGRSVAVSPGGGTVYVSGWSASPGGLSVATVAYDAVTGGQLWVARHSGAYNTNTAFLVAPSPTGETVYVTGIGTGITSEADYITIGYDAATGDELWATRYDGPEDNYDFAFAVAVSPDGARVYVTGASFRAEMTNADYATVAYDAATGDQLWVSRYNGPGNSDDYGRALAVSPGGGTLYVTGSSAGGTSGEDYATVAYNAATGARRWVSRYNGPGNSYDVATSMAISPAGTVLVTGYSKGTSSGVDIATVAVSASGTRLWARRYNGPGNQNDGASSLAAAGNGAVYVTGYSYGGRATLRDYVTIGYNTRTGARLWVQRYNGPGNRDDEGRSVAVRGGRVFVTGFSTGTTTGLDYATIAYQG